MNKVKNSDYWFECIGCGEMYKESVYCVAQRASGHDILFTCVKCGSVTNLPKYKK